MCSDGVARAVGKKVGEMKSKAFGKHRNAWSATDWREGEWAQGGAVFQPSRCDKPSSKQPGTGTFLINKSFRKINTARIPRVSRSSLRTSATGKKETVKTITVRK